MSISIHALLAESDRWLRISTDALDDISIHALLAESDTIYRTGTILEIVFLSTLSLRRATYDNGYGIRYAHNFYPRSPCGERRISMAMEPITHRFLSTLSLRRATGKSMADMFSSQISIHALLAESDRL